MISSKLHINSRIMLIYYSAEMKNQLQHKQLQSYVQSQQRRTKGKEKAGVGIIYSKETWQPECIQLQVLREIYAAYKEIRS